MSRKINQSILSVKQSIYKNINITGGILKPEISAGGGWWLERTTTFGIGE